jgi:chromosome segregation ATPase
METPFAVYDALASIEVPPEKVRAVVQSMERDMALFATRSQFSALDEHSSARYEILRAEIAVLRERMDQLAGRFGQVDGRFEQIDQRFDQVDKRFEQVDKRFEQVDKRFEQVDKRFEQVDQRFDRLHAEMLAMERRIELKLTVRMGAFLSVAIGATATVVKLIGA